MKKIGSISLAVMLSLAVGCGNGNNAPVQEPTPEPVEDIAVQEEVHKFVEKDFEDFFKAYFSYTDEELLVLNQQRSTTDEAYWQNLRTQYQKLISDKLGTYLADGLKNRVKVQYVQDEINLPKFVLMNSYVVSGKGEVTNVEIKSTRDLGESTVYEVAVTTANKCYPVTEFIQNYTWGDTQGYFVKRAEGLAPMELQGVNLDEITKQNYMFAVSDAADEMKIEQNFWLTVEDKDILQIESIKSASDWGVMTQDKNQVLDSQYINRVSYEVEPDETEKTLISRLFMTLFEQPRSVYDNMKTAYNTNAKAFEKVFDDLGFMSKFEMNADTYKAAFTKELNPYKDEVAVFKVDEKNIKITPSVYSTLYQPRFVVTVPVEALHNNNQVVYYSYKYYVGMEKGKIELIQFMAVKASDQYEYTCGMNEAAVTKVAQEYSVDKDALVAAAQSVDMTLEELIATTKEGDNPNPINVAEAIKIANGGTAVEGEDSSEGQATEGNVTN